MPRTIFSDVKHEGEKQSIVELDPEHPEFDSLAQGVRHVALSAYEHYPYPRIWAPEYMRGVIAKGEQRIFAVTNNGKVTGTASLVANGPYWEFGRTAVEHGSRGKLLGKALVWHRLAAARGSPIYSRARAAEPASFQNIAQAFQLSRGGLHVLGIHPQVRVDENQEFLVEMAGNIGKPSEFRHPHLTATEFLYLDGFIHERRVGSISAEEEVHTDAKVGVITPENVSKDSQEAIVNAPHGRITVEKLLASAQRHPISYLEVHVPLSKRTVRLRNTLARKGFIPCAFDPLGRHIVYGKLVKKVKLGEVEFPHVFDDPFMGRARTSLERIAVAFKRQNQKL